MLIPLQASARLAATVPPEVQDSSCRGNEVSPNYCSTIEKPSAPKIGGQGVENPIEATRTLYFIAGAQAS